MESNHRHAELQPTALPLSYICIVWRIGEESNPMACTMNRFPGGLPHQLGNPIHCLVGRGRVERHASPLRFYRPSAGTPYWHFPLTLFSTALVQDLRLPTLVVTMSLDLYSACENRVSQQKNLCTFASRSFCFQPIIESLLRQDLNFQRAWRNVLRCLIILI